MPGVAVVGAAGTLSLALVGVVEAPTSVAGTEGQESSVARTVAVHDGLSTPSSRATQRVASAVAPVGEALSATTPDIGARSGSRRGQAGGGVLGEGAPMVADTSQRPGRPRRGSAQPERGPGEPTTLPVPPPATVDDLADDAVDLVPDPVGVRLPAAD